MTAAGRCALLGLAVAAASACVSAPPAAVRPSGPPMPAIAAPVIPEGLAATTELRNRHAAAWIRLQAGDRRAAAREYAACLRMSSAFYPAETGLGLVAIANGDYQAAGTHFRASLGRNERYVPAWRGLVDAELGAGSTDGAVAALERLLALDASQEADRERLELLRLRQVQAAVEAAARARDGGQLAEADRLLNRALISSPRSSILLRELAQVEARAGQLDQAEAHARQSIEFDPADAAAHAVLASVLERKGQLREAAAELSRAAAIDPAFRDRAAAASARADESAMPAEMRDLARRPTVTRGQLAALIGTRLAGVLASASGKTPAVATDVRGHWAAAWIIAVTQAGVMDVFANHTFQPEATVRRADLARAASALVALALSRRPDELSRWQAARPAFADLDASNLLYPAAALAVAAGAMSAAEGRFEPARPATGAEALAVMARMTQVAGRESR